MAQKYTTLISFFVILLFITTGCSSMIKPDAATQSDKNDAGITKDTITLKLADANPANSNMTKFIYEPFMERVTELTDGQVQFEFYPAEQMGKAADMLQLTADGVVDIGNFAAPYYSSKMPLSSALIGMPGLFETSYDGSMAYQKLVQKSPILETDFLSNGVRPILARTTSGYDFWTKGKGIKVPKDLKGMKIRSSGGASAAAMDYAGATPVTMSITDAFGAFDKGVLDALHLETTYVDAYGFNELVQYGTRGVSFGTGGAAGLVINEKVWNSLSKNIQKAIEQSAEEVMASGQKRLVENEEKLISEMNKSGNIKIYELSEKQKGKWQLFYTDFEKYWVKKQNNRDFNKALEMFREEVKNHQEQIGY